MTTCLVSYASTRFVRSQERLGASARRFGIDAVRGWTRADVEASAFYAAHRAILDRPRGSGFWLWKPLIVEATLDEMTDGEILVYADAGLEVTGDLSPLFDLCAANGGLLLFEGHYDDVGGPGPNVCGKWTKRDCFVLMGCDEPRFHDGRMLDASLLVLRASDRARAFVREWRGWCEDARLLTDDPNVCGRANLPTFVDHRHDQSILSLLAMREGVETFRHPSQYGNHLKLEPYRVAGEWTSAPYGAKGLAYNSPYPTLVNHHREALSHVQVWLSEAVGTEAEATGSRAEAPGAGAVCVGASAADGEAGKRACSGSGASVSAGNGAVLLVGGGVAFTACAAELRRLGIGPLWLLPGDGSRTEHAPPRGRGVLDSLGLIVYAAERPNWYDIASLTRLAVPSGPRVLVGVVFGDHSYRGPFVRSAAQDCWLCTVIRVVGSARGGAALASLREEAFAAAMAVQSSQAACVMAEALGRDLACDVMTKSADEAEGDEAEADVHVTHLDRVDRGTLVREVVAGARSGCAGWCEQMMRH